MTLQLTKWWQKDGIDLEEKQETYLVCAGQINSAVKQLKFHRLSYPNNTQEHVY